MLLQLVGCKQVPGDGSCTIKPLRTKQLSLQRHLPTCNTSEHPLVICMSGVPVTFLNLNRLLLLLPPLIAAAAANATANAAAANPTANAAACL